MSGQAVGSRGGVGVAGELTSAIPIYDHEKDGINQVVSALRDKQRSMVNLEAFRREVIGRFEEIGLVVNVLVYETSQSDLWWFDIEIVERTDPRPFDHERQAEEVQAIAGGYIDVNGLWIPR